MSNLHFIVSVRVVDACVFSTLARRVQDVHEALVMLQNMQQHCRNCTTTNVSNYNNVSNYKDQMLMYIPWEVHFWTSNSPYPLMTVVVPSEYDICFMSMT